MTDQVIDSEHVRKTLGLLISMAQTAESDIRKSVKTYTENGNHVKASGMLIEAARVQGREIAYKTVHEALFGAPYSNE